MREDVYKILWDPSALKAFQKISDKKLKGHIMDALENVLSHHPLAGKPLMGTYKGLRSYRLGVIRIVYEFYKSRLVIVVIEIAHRKDVYRPY